MATSTPVGRKLSQWRNVSSDKMTGFFTWWGEELLAMAPQRLRDELKARDRELVCSFEDGAVQLAASGVQEKVTAVPGSRTAERGRAEAYIRKHRGSWLRARKTIIRLPHAACFMRRVELPREARSKFREILKLDLERATPFTQASVFHDYHVTGPDVGNGKSVVEHVIVKREIVEEALAHVGSFDLRPTVIDVWDGDTITPLPVNLLPVDIRATATGLRLTSLRRYLALLVVLLGASALALAFHRQDRALSKVKEQISATQAQALSVRRTLTHADQISSRRTQLYQRRINALGVMALLEELSQRLPDGVWLRSIGINDGKAQISGYAVSAAGLIRLLERSAFITDVSFAAPVTTDPRLERERFTITFGLHSREAGG